MDRASSKWVVWAAALLAVPLPCPAQKPTAIPLVPAANWRQVESKILPSSAVTNYGGEVAVEQEYGVNSLEDRTYELAGKKVEVVVEAAPDASAAYGLLTYYQTTSMTPVKGIQLALSDPKGSLMARGPSFVRFLAPQGSSLTDNDWRALLIFVGGTRPSRNALASLPAPMPRRGLIPGSEKYFLGLEVARRVLPSVRPDLIGFNQGAEVQLADYQRGRERSRLVAITYPTPQIARVRFGAMSSFLGLNQEHGPAAVYGRRQGSFVFLVLNADTAVTATKLMDLFSVAQKVSWDQRYPGDKPFALQVLELILANILLILILVGFCIAGGILVFISKRLAHKYFPEWEWGDPEGESLIRLNLT
jgi:hypothetical protein